MDDLAQLTNRVTSMERAFERLYAGPGSARTLGDVMGAFMNLPGLVGFWPMGSVQRSTGNVYDLSGQGRTLTYNGNPSYNIYNGCVPYLDLDGTGDYLSRADETDLDILGTETIYTAAVRGITLGGWCWWDVAGTPGVTLRPFITKEPLTTFSPYSIQMEDVATQRVFARFSDSDAGTNQAIPMTTSAVSLNAWHCVIAKCAPGGTASLFVDGASYTVSAAAVAALYNSPGSLEIGRGIVSSQYLDGRAALCFLCAEALPDALLSAQSAFSLFNLSRTLFGV